LLLPITGATRFVTREHAILNQPIEPLELIVGVGDLSLQSVDAGIDGVSPF
jgi:hypothetical protein